MMRTPRAIRSRWIGASPSAPLTSLPRPLPSSRGRSSLMMRAETISASGAMPPGQEPNGLPAAVCATAVPWPTTSSTDRLLVAGLM